METSYLTPGELFAEAYQLGKGLSAHKGPFILKFLLPLVLHCPLQANAEVGIVIGDWNGVAGIGGN
jgi:hypothetical protein